MALGALPRAYFCTAAWPVSSPPLTGSRREVGFLPPGGVEKQELSRTWRVADVDGVLAFKNSLVRLIFAFKFTDKFGDEKETPITSGTFQEYPKGTFSFLRDRKEDNPQKNR